MLFRQNRRRRAAAIAISIFCFACTAETNQREPASTGKADGLLYGDEGFEGFRLKILGEVLGRPEIQEVLLADGFEFSNLVFEEADDGGTEPYYVMRVSKYDETIENFVSRCFGLGFDTDEPDGDFTSAVELDAEDCP